MDVFILILLESEGGYRMRGEVGGRGLLRTFRPDHREIEHVWGGEGRAAGGTYRDGCWIVSGESRRVV